MKLNSSYVPIDSAFPYKGLDSVSPSTIMNPSFSPNMLNTVIKDGRPTSRPGYDQMGNAVVGTTMLSEEFITAAGTKFLVIATTSREYYYDGSNEIFVEITAGFGAVTAFRDGGGADDEIDITGDFTLVYLVGRKLTVTGSTTSANDKVYTVVSSSYTSTTTTVLVTTGSVNTAEAGAAGTRARQDRTGVEANMVDFTHGSDSSGTYFFITNGVDLPRFWNGANEFAIFDDALITYPGIFASCKTLEILNSYLVLGAVYSSSAEYRIVAWSDTTDFFEFTAGNSGSSLVPKAIGDVWKLIRLSDRIAIYTQGGSVHLMAHVGGEVLFRWDDILEGLSLVGPRSIVNLGAFHILLSREGFFVFDGTRLILPYGNTTISRYIKEKLNPDYSIRAFSFNDAPNSQAYFTLPTGETTSVTLLLEYNLGDFRQTTWMPLKYTDRPTSFGFYSRHDNLTWDAQETADNTLAWNNFSIDAIWGNRNLAQGFPVKVMGSGTSIFRLEDSLANDNGVAFTSLWESVEMTMPREFRSSTGRWQEIEGEFLGKAIDIEYSTDSGKTWTFAVDDVDGSDADGVELTSSWQKLKFFIDVVSDTLIVRLSNPDISSGFSHRDLRVWVIEGGRN